MPIGGLEDPCPTCGRTSGDHTLREWADCLGTTNPAVARDFGPADDTGAAIRAKFGIDDDVLIADHVLVEAGNIDGSAGGETTIKVPVLIHNFAIGEGDELTPVARVLYMAEPDGLADYAGLIAECTAAANRTARA